MSKEDTREKQEYLRTEILEAGYDANLFLEYMDKQKGRIVVE
jgi:hypothetical protein